MPNLRWSKLLKSSKSGEIEGNRGKGNSSDSYSRGNKCIVRGQIYSRGTQLGLKWEEVKDEISVQSNHMWVDTSNPFTQS